MRSPAALKVGDGDGDAAVSASPTAAGKVWEWASLVTRSFFIAALRLHLAGALLVAFAMPRGWKQPSGWEVWLAIAAFKFINAAYMQMRNCSMASSRRDCRRRRLGFNKFGEEEKRECWTSNLLKIEFDTKGQQIDSCGTLVAGVVCHLIS